MDGQRPIVAGNNHVVEPPDYADNLEPGYRFCPTDVEIIVYYLIPHIEKGTHPPCRLHKVNIYDHTPEELAAAYRPCDANWYFLTPRGRRYLNGKRPSRTTKGFGYWHASQSDAAVVDPVSKQEVGRKRSLAYFEGKKKKTSWLMHEYTMNDPDLPIGNENNPTKLTDWVICKIYKKPGSKSENKKQRGLVSNTKNQQEEDEEQNQPLDDQPSPKRQRLSHGSSQQNELEHPQFHEEANNHSSTHKHDQFQKWMFDSDQQYLSLEDIASIMGESNLPMGYPDQPVHDQQLFATDKYQQNINETSICQPQGLTHCERPLQAFTSDEVHGLIGFSTVHHHDYGQSMSTTTNIARYSSDDLTAPPTPQPTENGNYMMMMSMLMISPTSTNVPYHAASPLTPPTPQPLDDGDNYMMSPNSTPATSTFQVTEYMRNWVRDNILSYR